MERTGSKVSGLTPVVLHGGGHVYHGQIDGHAVLQLARDVDVAEVLRRERLQLVRPLSAAASLYLVAAESGEDGLQIASRLAAAAGVVEAVPDLYTPRVRHAIEIPPNDPDYRGQWYFKKVVIEKAWRLSSGDADTKIAVVDDGCDMQHEDLKNKFKGGIDLVDQDDDPSYDPDAKNNAHGTACAGLVAAETDNGIGMAGTCPECSLLCVRLLPGSSDRGVPMSADIGAFDFAMKQGAAVVSNSWGFAESQPAPAPLRALLEKLYDDGRDGRGTLVVFAAGNENREIEANELAAVRGVVTVGAINNFDEAAPFSNSGASLSVTAPAGTYTTDISGSDGMDKGDYSSSFGGTSSACPVVAGIAGLILSASKDITAADARDLLQTTTRSAPFAEPDSAGHDKTYGYGIVDPAAALRKALGLPPEPSTPADAGVSDSSKDSKEKSGGCAVSSDGGGSAALWMIGLGLWVWTRRQRHLRH